MDLTRRMRRPRQKGSRRPASPRQNKIFYIDMETSVEAALVCPYCYAVRRARSSDMELIDRLTRIANKEG